MTEITHRFVETNGIRMHIAEAGSGPLVLLCHGWPESWYSWRHQLTALADAGYHAVAPDQRGYGQTDAPDAIDQYTQFHLIGDLVGLLDALGEETAVIAGHDWGSIVTWSAALLRPDRFRAVISMSVPFSGRGAGRPTEQWKAVFGDNFFYILYFQTPGVAEHEFEHDVRKTMRSVLFSASGDVTGERLVAPRPKTAGFLDGMTDPENLPAWLTEADIDFYTGEFTRTGFRGGINWYRNFDRNWELLAPWAGAKVTQPSLFIAGEKDSVIRMVGGRDAVMAGLKRGVPNLKDVVMLDGCGHWTQQERPSEVNAAMIGFLRSL
jgi:pimeloyl-ACP methyl ester carboxylesterase